MTGVVDIFRLPSRFLLTIALLAGRIIQLSPIPIIIFSGRLNFWTPLSFTLMSIIFAPPAFFEFALRFNRRVSFFLNFLYSRYCKFYQKISNFYALRNISKTFTCHFPICDKSIIRSEPWIPEKYNNIIKYILYFMIFLYYHFWFFKSFSILSLVWLFPLFFSR